MVYVWLGLIAVSYTHLDVSKRQGPHRAGGGVVGIVAIGKDADVFDFIRARAQNCGLADSSLCRKAVRTAIGLEVNLNGLCLLYTSIEASDKTYALRRIKRIFAGVAIRPFVMIQKKTNRSTVP